MGSQDHGGRARTHTGKYEPLWRWLLARREDRLQPSFEEIERILGFPLPPSSRRHAAHWYSYEGSAVVRAVVDAGWRACEVDLAKETVVFVREA
jgi:hypothetical protein